MNPFSTATAAVFVRYSTFTGRAQTCGGFHYWHNTTNCYSCSWFCTILLDFSSMFLCKILFSSSSKVRLPFPVLQENKALYLESANGRCSVKKMGFFVTFPWCGHWLNCFARKSYSHKRLPFFPDYFTGDENGRNSFSKEFSCSSTINEFRTATVCRIFNYSTEHLKVPGNYR